MSNEPMAARKADGGRSPQITVTLSAGCLRDFEAVATHKGIPLATYVKNVVETHHESSEFASILRRAKKTGDWADMEIVELIEGLSTSKRQEAIAYLKSLAE